MLPFNYDPLDHSKRGIRLLRLLKFHADPICCELFEAQVTDRGCDTPYEALSYVWGSSDLTHRIEVNGKELSITANLHVALSYIRLVDADRVLWVDAVCIDQNNHKERGHQVQQMGDIYRQARQVVIWLGEATFETDAFMTVLQKLQIDMESEESPYRNWVPKYDNPSQQYWYKRWMIELQDNMRSRNPNSFSEKTHETFSYSEMECAKRGFDDILDRTWFRRVWILQEVANACTVVIHCGRLSVPGLYFAAAEDIIQGWYGGAKFAPSFAGPSQVVLEIMPTRRLALDSWWTDEGGRTMFSLLKHFGQSEATDQRDIVYALRGMSTDNGNPNLPAVNYEIPEKSVAERTACFIFHCAITSWARLDSVSDLIRQLDWLLAASIAIHLEWTHCLDLSHLPNGGRMEITLQHLEIPFLSGHWTLIDKILSPSTAGCIIVCPRKLAKTYRNCDFHVPESMRFRSGMCDVELLYTALENPHMGAHIIDEFWENAINKENAGYCASRVLWLVWGDRNNDDYDSFRRRRGNYPERLAAESLAALVSQIIRSRRALTPFDHNWKNQEGETLLGYAIKTGKISLAQKLLVLGANPQQWSMGWSLLMLTAMHPHDCMEEITMTLLRSGINIHLVNVQGETAMTLAKKHGNTKVVRMLSEWLDFDPHKEPHKETCESK